MPFPTSIFARKSVADCEAESALAGGLKRSLTKWHLGTLFAFVLVSVGVIFLRAADPERPRPFRVPGVPYTPLISVAACLYLMLQLPAVTWIRFGIWLAVGLVFYFVYGFRHSALRAGTRPHIEPVKRGGH